MSFNNLLIDNILGLTWYEQFYYSPIRLIVAICWFYLCIYSVRYVEFSRAIPPQIRLWAKIITLLIGPLAVFCVMVMEAFKKAYESENDFFGVFVAHLAKFFKIQRKPEQEKSENFIELLDISGQSLNDIYKSTGEIKAVSQAVNFTKEMISNAISSVASDILIDPVSEAVYQIRFRVDGLLREYDETDKSIASALINSIKAVSRMDIAERRRPQDGSFNAKTSQGSISFRVASVGALNGEKLSIRVLDQSRGLKGLNEIGLSEKQFEIVNKIIHQPTGMILICGPTGSGKTTTLYSILKTINAGKRNIISVEDPIEYQISNVSQLEVNVKADITFGKVLRSVLRQNPDVICVGEIRDEETANIAFQAAQTGHLVIATMHSNNNISTLVRLLDLGVKPLMIASAINLVISQRLIRCLCDQCKSPETLAAESVEKLGSKGVDYKNIFRAGGCVKCGHTGYTGRTGIYDVMAIDENIKKQILEGKITSASVAAATGGSGQVMKKEALKKVLLGKTTLSEVKRVVATGNQ